MENRFESYTFLILKAAKQVQEIKTRAMEPYGLKAVHVMCLHYLQINAEGLTAAEIVRRTLEDKAAISRALHLLWEKGYVNYQPGERNSRITLTPAGGEVAAYIASCAQKAVEVGGAGLSEKTRTTFYKALSTISDNLGAYLDSGLNA